MTQSWVKWLCVTLETSTLVGLLTIAYLIDEEAIESTVGPYLLHTITISLLIMLLIKDDSDGAREYAKVYSCTNLVVDVSALVLMLFRYEMTLHEKSHRRQNAAHLALFCSYIVIIGVLLIIDVHK